MFPSSYLELPVALANPEIRHLMVSQAESMLGELDDEPAFLRELKTTIAGGLATARASLANAARSLSVSTRTLHRRLAEHEVTPASTIDGADLR